MSGPDLRRQRNYYHESIPDHELEDLSFGEVIRWLHEARDSLQAKGCLPETINVDVDNDGVWMYDEWESSPEGLRVNGWVEVWVPLKEDKLMDGGVVVNSMYEQQQQMKLNRAAILRKQGR